MEPLRALYADSEKACRYDVIAALGNLALGGDRRIDRAVARELALAPGRRVLDVGAGTGRLAPSIAAAVRPGGSLVLLDGSPAMLGEARARGRIVDGVEALAGDATSLPFPDRSFDRVLLSWLLHEMAPGPRDAALREAVRVLSGGGVLVIVDHGAPRGLPARAWWRLVRRGLANRAERETLAWHLGNPPADVVEAAGLPIRRRLSMAGGLVRIDVAVRPG